MTAFSDSRVTAVLGPTNTGKTHLAIERMLGHESGVIGFPLRLLARENYDRIARIKGRGRVALVTGEEKIVPAGARYFCCTVESMPLERPFAFLAVDEIQLAADAERGHIFTDRLLHARGLEETMFLGADTMAATIRDLVPEAERLSRPRFSELAYAGMQSLNRLPPRSAVVAFSAADVYATAELMRRRRGGTAVVLGALSPRTRNAQVAMFEAGEVDYLVATDAIGMGLNLSLDHVAFAGLRKFDGRQLRPLSTSEVGQIAGRAGRHMNDGTFGTTPQAGTLRPDIVEAVEEHKFDAIKAVYWRNRRLDFNSPRALLRSLEQRPRDPSLMKVQHAEDQQALASLIRAPEILARATTPGALRLLWDVCQVPDFRKLLAEHHVQLLARLYLHLMDGDGCLPESWVAGHVAQTARSDGGIDLLSARIAQIRTWTYIAHRGGWLEDSQHWQGRTREIEDMLSDALHERLTQRFVDRRAAVLAKRLRQGSALIGALRKNGDVLVEGEHVGRLKGFQFVLDASVDKDAERPVLAAARQALRREIPKRLGLLESDDNGSFLLSDGRLLWRGAPLAKLQAGDNLLSPGIEILPSEFLDGPAQARVRRRLTQWLESHLRNRLAPLFALREAPLQGAARGLAFQVVERLGLCPRRFCAAQVGALSKADRAELKKCGVAVGSESCFLQGLARDRDGSLRATLWCLYHGEAFERMDVSKAVSARPRGGQASFFPLPKGWPDGLCYALGYLPMRVKGRQTLALRADHLEAVAGQARRLAAQGAFPVGPSLSRRFGGKAEDAESVLLALGYRRGEDENGAASFRRVRRKPRPSRPSVKVPQKNRAYEDSPFAVLKTLAAGNRR
jgi:ATP-dependent RNA helicase SUPV3L1/SUV3